MPDNDRYEQAVEVVAQGLCRKFGANTLPWNYQSEASRTHWREVAAYTFSLADPSGQPWVAVLAEDQGIAKAQCGPYDFDKLIGVFAYLHDREGVRRIILPKGGNFESTGTGGN